MNPFRRPTADNLWTLAALVALLFAAGCGGNSGNSGGGGGGGGGTPAGCVNSSDQAVAANRSVDKAVTPLGAQNVAPLTIDGGPKNNYVNGVFTTVTVCLPGSTGSCQTIDHVLVDTGSFGLRLLTTTGGGQLNLATLHLPAESDAVGPLAECAQFSDGITWGAVRMADIYIGGPTANNMLGEKALNIPLQVIADSSVGSPPSACTAFGTPEDDISGLMANGIIGIGPFQQDCGPGCVKDSSIGLYYHCSSGNCSETAISLAQQVINPIAVFSATASGATDNNGSIMQLPAVPLAGASLVNGSLVFGIGTETNNGLAGATVYTADSGGDITTVFAQRTLASSFIDSGSNGYFFLTTSTSSIPTCSDTSNAPGFYCYPNNLTCSAVNQGANGAKGTVTFNIADASALVQNGNAAYNNLAGPNTPPPNPGGPTMQTGFDWGLTFFYGRNVFTGIEGVPDAHGNPQVPFYAY